MDYVYLIHAKETNRYKIGRTGQSPTKRLQGLQTGCPHELELVFCIETDTPNEQEDMLHWFNEESRVHGEWFEFDDSEVDGVIDRMAQHLARRFVRELSEMIHKSDCSFLSGHNRAATHLLSFVASRLAGCSGKEINPCKLISDLLELGYITEEQVQIVYDEMHARGNAHHSKNDLAQ